MRLLSRWKGEAGPPAEVLARAELDRGERVLASGIAHDGTWLLGTRHRLLLVGAAAVHRLGWHEVADAAWDADASTLRVTALAAYGEPQPTWDLEMDEPPLLLQLVRERVTSSIVVRRHVAVAGRRGFSVVGRRDPRTGTITWMHVYDPGVDPSDPAVAALAGEALTAARAEVGETA